MANKLPGVNPLAPQVILRGVGQVMLQENAATGALFLLGIFVAGWVYGLYALLGTVVATGSAWLGRAHADDIRRGLYGFNGTLTALAVAVLLPHGGWLPLVAVVAAAGSTLVMAGMRQLLGSAGGALTAPFVVTTWIVVAALGAAPAAGVAAHGWGILNGLAQVMLLQSPYTGALFLLALAVNSRRAAAAAVVGSALAAAIGWGLGAAASDLRAGLYGFNAVLTAIAVAEIFPLRRSGWLWALAAVGGSTLLYAGMAALRPWGLPVVTAPFVLTTWLCMFGQRFYPRGAAARTATGV